MRSRVAMLLCAAALAGCDGVGLWTAPAEHTAGATGSSGSGSGSGSSSGSSAGSTTSGTSSGSTASTGGTTATSTTSSTSGTTGVAHTADVAVVGTLGFSGNSGAYDIALSPDGYLFATDLRDNAIVTFNSGQGSIVAGGNSLPMHQDGSGTSARLAAPWGAVFVGTTLYFIDSGDSGSYAYLRTLDPSGNVATVCGSGVSTAAANGACGVAQFAGPAGLAYDGSNFIYVADYGESRIQRVNLVQGQVETWAGSSSAGFTNAQGSAAQFSSPAAVAVDAQGNVFVADFGNHAIRKIDPSRNVTTFATIAGRSMGVAVDGAGNVYASDLDNSQIYRWTASGTLTAQVTDPALSQPAGLKWDGAGHLLVGNVGNANVLQLTIP